MTAEQLSAVPTMPAASTPRGVPTADQRPSMALFTLHISERHGSNISLMLKQIVILMYQARRNRSGLGPTKNWIHYNSDNMLFFLFHWFCGTQLLSVFTLI